MSALFKVRYPDHHDFYQVHYWVTVNIVGKHYSGVDWKNWRIHEKNRIFEFEREEDAIKFALHWL